MTDSNPAVRVVQPAPGQPTEAEIFTVVAGVIAAVCGLDSDRLRPDQRVQDLDIDSMFAGEIIAQTERALRIGIDFRRVSDDWSELTLADLVEQFRAGSGDGERPSR